MNLGTFKKYSGLLDLKNVDQINEITVLMPNTKYDLLNEYGIKLHTTRAKHYEIIDEQYAIGFIIEINDKIKIGFTGDTGWDEKMVKPFIELKPQLVVAHIGSVKRKEFNYAECVTEDEKNKCFYSNHLGLLGVTKFLKETEPSLAIVSEFGEELREMRKLIVESIGNTLGLWCLPGDIGLHIRLCDLNIHCFVKEDFVDFRSIKVLQKESALYFCGENPDQQRFTEAWDEKCEQVSPLSPLAKRTASYIHSTSRRCPL